VLLDQWDRSVLPAFRDLVDPLDTRDWLVVAEIADSPARLERLGRRDSLASAGLQDDPAERVSNVRRPEPSILTLPTGE